MENSQWLQPSFFITVAVGLIGLVAWFIRLESKTNSNQIEIERINKAADEAYSTGKIERKAADNALYNHLMDNSKHYNEQFMNEFKAALDRRFVSMEGTLRDISGKIDRAIK
jgi:hypothetical protein